MRYPFAFKYSLQIRNKIKGKISQQKKKKYCEVDTSFKEDSGRSKYLGKNWTEGEVGSGNFSN